jgi:Uma2 family endonuclease
MGHPAEKHPRATYADLEAVPAHQVAELIEGTLYVMPRPAPRHANTSSALGGELHGPFRKGIGVLDPDIAGWRRERMPTLPATAYFDLAPDWVCEVVSKSTEKLDREVKMPVYAREGVRHAWLLDPIAKTLEVYTLERGRRWGEPQRFQGDARVRVAPFDAVELDLSLLWAE